MLSGSTTLTVSAGACSVHTGLEDGHLDEMASYFAAR